MSFIGKIFVKLDKYANPKVYSSFHQEAPAHLWQYATVRQDIFPLHLFQ